MEVTKLEPLELAAREDLEQYFAILGGDPDMVRLVKKCPVCEKAILVPDNGVWLDAKSVDQQEREDDPLTMVIFKLGPLAMAGSGGEPNGGSHHAMHDHQPEGS